MAVTEEVLLKVNAAESLKTVGELRKRISELKKELNSASIGGTRFNEILDSLEQYQNKLNNAIKLGTTDAKRATESYNSLSRQMSELKQRYKAAKTEMERTNLAGEINKINTRLKEMDASVGVFGRNVGNYERAALGFGNLQFQIQQVARELPSLSIGFDMFFLAISNNLPMLVDELGRAKEAIKAMKDEGKTAPSLFGAVAKNIFSWQTALIAVITLLTMFSNDIVNWAKNLISASRNVDATTKATRGLQDAMREGNDTLAEQITTIRTLQIGWDALGNNLSAQEKYIKDNQEAFADLGVSISTTSDFENVFIENTSSLINALNNRARATAAQELAQKSYKDALIERAKVEEKIAKGTTDTVVESYGVGSELMKPVRREYTESEKEEMMQGVYALEAEAEAYLQIANNSNEASEALLNLFQTRKSSEDREGSTWGGDKGDSILKSEERDWLLQIEEDYYQEEALLQEHINEMNRIREAGEANWEKIQEDAAKETIRIAKDQNDKREKIARAEKKWQKDKYDYIASIANSASQLAGEETAVGKALAVASTTISTYSAAQQAYASQFMPVPTPSSPARGAIAAAAAIASGLANVRSILSVKSEHMGSSGSTASFGGASVSTYAPAIIQQAPVTRSLTGASEEERLNSIESGVNKPVKAYVVGSEMQGQLLYDEQVADESSF